MKELCFLGNRYKNNVSFYGGGKFGRIYISGLFQHPSGRGQDERCRPAAAAAERHRVRDAGGQPAARRRAPSAAPVARPGGSRRKPLVPGGDLRQPDRRGSPGQRGRGLATG